MGACFYLNRVYTSISKKSIALIWLKLAFLYLFIVLVGVIAMNASLRKSLILGLFVSIVVLIAVGIGFVTEANDMELRLKAQLADYDSEKDQFKSLALKKKTGIQMITVGCVLLMGAFFARKELKQAWNKK